jgi:hypothetical protein
VIGSFVFVAAGATATALLYLRLSGFVSGSLSGESESIGASIFLFFHLYPTNGIVGYLAARMNVRYHDGSVNPVHLLLLWILQNFCIYIFVGLQLPLLPVTGAFLYLGAKHQQALQK